MATFGLVRRKSKMSNHSAVDSNVQSPAWALSPGDDKPGRQTLGIDIGGANIKAATESGDCYAIAFAMWLRPDDLAAALIAMAKRFAHCDAWAVTMTGEMADAYFDRPEGVQSIVAQTMRAAHATGIDEVRFYSVDGCFIDAAAAVDHPDAVASANWHALALWIAQAIDSPALVIDVGSTTTDIIPIGPGEVTTESRTDFDRLVQGELVYVGGGRTPVCSLVSTLPLRGRPIPVMREVFATTDDCALVLGWCSEDADDKMTSDGGPRTIDAAVNRLARMVGLDHRGVTTAEAADIAIAVVNAATALIADAISKQSSQAARRWVVSGHTGDYFLSGLLSRYSGVRVEPLAQRLGVERSRVGPALACAALYRRQAAGKQTG